MSKQFVAACVLLLAERGRLSVTDPVSRWFPGAPQSWDDMTIANVLTHTAGLGHWPDYPAIAPTRSIDDDVFVAAVQGRPVALPADHAYSSLGYGLLARLVERASGLSYATCVADYVLSPLDMRDTFVGNADGRSRIARGYRGARELASFELDTTSKGTGDIWSTTGDIDQWDQALLSDALLSAASRDLMFRPSAPIRGLPDVLGYGFGWMVGERHGERLYFHPGDNPGFKSFNAIIPSSEARVVLLTNDETTDIITPATRIIESLIA